MNLKSKDMDMLHGALTGKLLYFTLPIALSSMIQQLFNAADTAVVGYFGNAGALAAVGTNTEIIALIVTVSSGLSIGINSLIANHIGRNEAAEIPAAIQTAIAGSTIAMNFEYFTYYIITAFGQTAATFTSQNFAAAQLERCRRILRLCLVSSTVCSSIPIFTIVMLRSLFSGIFTTSAASLPTLFHAFPLSWAATIVLVNLGFLILHPLKDSGAVNNRAFNH